MLLKRLLLFVGLFTASTILFSQGQTDWWYFGQTAGVHFNTSPSAVTNGQISTSEGVATISDANGNLLFYSDGIVVKNANHATMTNGTGLLGGGSSAQSGVVVPKPGSSTDYYLFTVAPFGSTNGFRYTHIDMTQSSGLGAVNNSMKNVFLMGAPTEKIAVVPKPGGYWVMTAKHSSDTMYVYSVTSAGVNPTPVKSATGVTTGNPNGSVSYLKANIQGTRLAGGTYNDNKVALYDFNKNTGVVSNGFTFTAGTSQHANYGVEFSPNGNLVYAQGWGSANTRQYNIYAGTAAQIAASVTNLGPGTGGGGGALQLGRDGMIYVCRYGQSYLDRISNPDVQGTGAGYTTNAVSLNNRVCRWGLPTFIQAFFGASIEVVDNCYGDTTYFTADTTNVDSMYWEFGDYLSGSNNTAAGLETVGHLYTDTGTYTVSLIIYGSGGLVDTVTNDVYIYPRQTVDLGPDDTTLCQLGVMVLNVDQPWAEYLWHDGSTDSAYIVTYPDSFVSVTINGLCDTIADSIYIDYSDYPLDIVDDTFFCSYDTLFVSTNLFGSSFTTQWNTGSQSPNINVTTPGTYSVTVNDEFCEFIDSATYTFYPDVEVDLGNDSSFCYESLVNLTPKSVANAVSFEWSSASSGSVISTSYNIDVTQTDKYYVTVTDGGNNCHAIDSVEWKLWFEPVVNLGNDTSFCHNDILNVTPFAHSAFPIEYFWNDGSNNPYLNINLVGLYWVEVSDENCSIRDTVIIDQYPRLDVNLGEDINTCEGKTITLNPVTTLPVLNYAWTDGSNGSQLKVTEHGTYTVSVNNELCSATDVVNVFYHDYPDINIGPDTSICPGAVIYLNASTGQEITEYSWSTGNKASVQEVVSQDSAWYWVEALNVSCRSVDSILITKRKVPNMELGADTSICLGSTLPLSVIYDPSIQSYRWSTEETDEAIEVSESGEYFVTVNDGYCDAIGKISISIKDIPDEISFSLDAPETICIGERVEFNMYDPRISAYEWQDGSTGSRYEVISEGLYFVKATHSCGTVTDTAFIDKCECPIWLPNAFNPNGDKLNDSFIPVTDCEFIDYEFSIYNRWGLLMFSTEDPTESWDGKNRGAEVEGDVYSWKLNYKAKHEGKVVDDQKNGTVLLMR